MISLKKNNSNLFHKTNDATQVLQNHEFSNIFESMSSPCRKQDESTKIARKKLIK